MQIDDIVFIAKDKHGLQLGMNALYGYCMENDLTVNTNKSQLKMQVSRRKSTNQPEIYYSDTPLIWDHSFRYLGVNISRTNKLSKGLNEICQHFC